MKTSIRQCIACRYNHPKSALLRVIKTPDGKIYFDQKQRMNGRGVYLCREKRCISQAQKNDLIGKTVQIKTALDIYTELAKQTQNRMPDTVDSLLGFGVRSKKVILGIMAVSKAMKKKKAQLIILDRDTSLSTRKKIEGLSRSLTIPVIIYKKKSLEKVIGKINCKCIAVIDSAFAQSILNKIKSN